MRRLGVGLAIAAVLLGACDGGDNVIKPEGADKIRNAAAATRTGGTSKLSIVADVTGGPSAGKTTGDGEFDFAKDLGHFTITLPSQLGGAGEVVIAEDLVYVKSALLPRWFRVDAAGAAAIPGSVGSLLRQLRNIQPSTQLNVLRGATDAKVEGTETIRGTPTTHYAATVSVEVAVQAATAQDRPALEALKASLGVPTLPVGVWLDDDGRVRRLDFTVAIPNGGGSLHATVELFDFGTAVTASPPPAKDTGDIKEIAPFLGGSTS